MISLGIDLGGTGVKCVAFDDKGTQLGLSYKEYGVPSGTVNLPADTLWDATAQVIKECVAGLENPSDVVAITPSSFGESFVSIDKDGKALTDILMYFGDTSSAEFDAVVKKVGEEKFMKISKIYPHAFYSLSKMLYTLKLFPNDVWKFLFITNFVAYRLSGKTVSDASLATRSLLWDVKKNEWSEELLSGTGIDKKYLPDVVPAGGIAGTVLPSVAAALGLPEGVKVVMGVQDQIANALGAGVVKPGDAVDTSGTCECITPLFPEVPDTLEFQRDNYPCLPYINTGAYVTYAYNFSAGSVVRWMRDFSGMSYGALNDGASDEPTDMLVLPFLQGMGGTPDVDPAATGCIMGLTTNTRMADVYRAILEGITFEMRYNQEKLLKNGVKLNKLYACGGGARSPKWLQIKADIMGCDIYPVLVEETGAMGSAILGLSAVCGQDPLELAQKWTRCGAPIHPIAAHQAIYEKRYNMYKTLRSFYLEQRKTEK